MALMKLIENGGMFRNIKLYADALGCLKSLSAKYKIGIIANQSLGTKERLEEHGILQATNERNLME